MTELGIKTCVEILREAFPQTYQKFTAEMFKGLFTVWKIQFSNFEDSQVYLALNEVLAEAEFPPAIATIKKHLVKEENENEEEVWRVLLKAGRNDIAYAREEWEKLPDKLKEVTTPQTLVEIGRASDEAVRFIKKDIMAVYSERKQAKRQELLTSFANVPQLEGK